MVCNLNVLVAAVYRVMHKSELEETNQTKTPNPSTQFSFASHSRVSRSRNFSPGHPSVLGPPLAVAVGGITTGGPLGNGGAAGGGRNGLDGGVRIHTETVEWSHSSVLDIKGDSNLSFKDIPSSLDLEDSEDETFMVDSPGKKTQNVSFDKDLERGDSYPLRNFSRPSTPNTKKSNKNSKSNEDKDGKNGS
jgi:hypothetical protein